MADIRPADHVRFAVLDGFVIVLDLRAGTYASLDRAASERWCRFASGAFGEDRHLDPDDATFLAHCENQGYVTKAARPRGAEHPRRGAGPSQFVPLAAFALYALIDTARSIKSRGFAKVYRELAELRHARATGARSGVARAESAIAFAELFYTGEEAPKDCLPRSLAIYRTLLRGGLAPVHRIGVARAPFQAHAWVECDGRPIRDSADFLRQFTVIAELP